LLVPGNFYAKITIVLIDLVSVIALTTALGCGQSFSEKQDDDKLKNFSTEIVQITILQEDQLGQYKVLFRPTQEISFTIIKHDLLEVKSNEIASNINEPFTDEEVISGHVYRYEISFPGSQKYNAINQTKEIRIPLDIILGEDETYQLDHEVLQPSLNGITPIQLNRVYLSQGSQLLTGAGRLKLQIEDLTSDNGTISNFKSEQKAAIGNEGQSGGELHFEVEVLRGEIMFILRGEDGGDGVRPDPLGEEGRGEEGNVGTDGYVRIIYSSRTGYEQETICEQFSGRGTPGGKGKKGRTANNGLAGGNSGLATIAIQDSQSANVSYRFVPGRGGQPSPGGKGGPGGFGGSPGGAKVEYNDLDRERDYTIYVKRPPGGCSGSTGPHGPEGDEGDPGVVGEDGNSQRICIQRNKGEAMQCFS